MDLLKHCRIKTLHFFLLWVFGFFLLLSFDLFMEGIVFSFVGFLILWTSLGVGELFDKVELMLKS
ncbi:MAG: hypothetical protein MK371_05145, partial [SAR86 cluster bacterium]|nr:hypothetical protein [SAR86 cluster bacterium]